MGGEIVDSVQRRVVDTIKYEVKRDLGYKSIKARGMKDHPLFEGKKYMMECPKIKYGYSFNTHVMNWLKVFLYNPRFLRERLSYSPSMELTENDRDIITSNIYKWIEKMNKETLFL